MRNIRRASGAMASKAKRPGSVIVRGGRRSDASTRAKRVARAPARARTIVRPSAVAASGAPPITVAGSVQRPGSRSEPSVRPEVTSIRARVVAAPLGVAVYSDRHPAAGWPAGSARGEPAPSARVRSAPARSSTRSPGAVVGAAACSPHPARPRRGGEDREGGERARAWRPQRRRARQAPAASRRRTPPAAVLHERRTAAVGRTARTRAPVPGRPRRRAPRRGSRRRSVAPPRAVWPRAALHSARSSARRGGGEGGARLPVVEGDHGAPTAAREWSSPSAASARPRRERGREARRTRLAPGRRRLGELAALLEAAQHRAVGDPRAAVSAAQVERGDLLGAARSPAARERRGRRG